MLVEEEELLSAIIPAIEKIDGGCGHCIDSFVHVANEELKEVGSKWQYKFINTEKKFGVELRA